MDEHTLPIGILTAGPGDAAEVARAITLELSERLGPVAAVPVGPTAGRTGPAGSAVAALAGLVVTGELSVGAEPADVTGWLGPMLDALSAGVPVLWSGVRLPDGGVPAWAASLVREAVAACCPVTVADEASRRCLALLGAPGAALLPHWTKGRAQPEAEVLAAHWDAFAERVDAGVAGRAVPWAEVLALLEATTTARDVFAHDLAVVRETAAAEAAAHERTATAAAAALAAQTAAVEELTAALAAVRAQEAEERAERTRLQQAVVERDAWIDATRRSASWRWTTPMRRLARLLRRRPEPIAVPVPLGRLTLVPAPAGDEPLRSAG